MNFIHDVLAGGVLVITLAVISAVLLFDYLWRYATRGLLLRRQLKTVAEHIEALANKPRPTLRGELEKVFDGTACHHAWSEYEETLHNQYDIRDGERKVREVRATVPSESFINLETTVDPRIGSEYFKHLPGIFTGLGIIGTFNGLIQGLVAFNPDVDADALKVGLSGLFGHVLHAFSFSMMAIILAMTITVTEKWIYAACAKWVGRVSQKLDGLFRAGVGEEYLSDLLRSSQDNATQTRQLKESLVQDLKELLTQLAERQIAATQQLSTEIGERIEGSLKEPLAHIADTVRTASGQQTSMATTAIETLMRAFIDKMQETLGGQMDGLNEMMRTSAQSMAQVEAAMRSLVTDMQRVSGESTSGMQQAVRDLIEQMGEQQRLQTSQSTASMNNLLAQVELSIKEVARQQESMSQRSEQSVATLMEAMHERVDQLASSNRETQERGIALAASLGEVSTKAISGLEEGALAVGQALDSVRAAVERLGTLTEKMSSLQSGLGQSAQQIAQSSNVLSGAAQSLSTATGSLGTATSRLEVLGKLVQAEGEARSGMLEDLRRLTQQAQQTGQSLTSLTDEVRDKLVEMVEKFGAGVSQALEHNLATYNKQLSDAVGMLKSAFEEIAESVDAAS